MSDFQVVSKELSKLGKDSPYYILQEAICTKEVDATKVLEELKSIYAV